MDIFDSRYYKMNRLLLTLIGQWPYLDFKTKLMGAIFMLSCLTSAVVVQFVQIVTMDLEMDALMETVQLMVPCLSSIVHYCTWCFNQEKMRKLLEMIRYDWSSLKTDKEFEIISRYTEEGRLYALILTCLFYLMWLGFVFLGNLPFILDVILPLNETRPRELALPGEYFVDTEKYFFYIHAYMHVYGFVILSAILINTNMLEVYVQHVCAMFTIIGSHLERLYNVPKHVTYNDQHFILRYDYRMHNQFAEVVELHNRTLEYSATLVSVYILPLFTLLGFIIVLMALDTFQLYQALLERDPDKIVMCILHLFGVFSTTFIGCFEGQKLIDHSGVIFDQAYESEWFLVSPKAQKMLLFFMMRSVTPCTIAKIKSITTSFELFGKIIQSSVSYLAVLVSFA